MPSELITSPANPLLKRIRKLRQRKHREEHGAVFVEGIAPVWQALESGVEVETLLVAPDLLTSERAAELVAAHEAAGVTVARVSADAFAAVAERDNPAGLGAVVRPVPLSLDDL
nr:RNA methyltransferase [Actinomycetota bacterium]